MADKAVYTDRWVVAKDKVPVYTNWFCVPTDAEIDALVPGRFVKISNGIERFIVQLTNIDSDKQEFVGRLRTPPSFSPYKLYDYVRFRRENIFKTGSVPITRAKSLLIYPAILDAVENGIPLDLIKCFCDTFTPQSASAKYAA